MKVREVYNSRLVRLLNKVFGLKINAMVVYPFVLFSEPRQGVLDSTYRHEMVHVEQIKTVGVFRFYISYYLYLFAGLIKGESTFMSYYYIPYEVEARKLAASRTNSTWDRV